jgi:SAM-dependent methyltransferase
MASRDPYAATDLLDDSLLQVIITRLETRGKHPLFEKMLQDYLDAMQIATAKTVLDIGCGTGVAARAIARRRGFSGHVLGIDLSPVLTQTAAQLAADLADSPSRGRSRPIRMRPIRLAASQQFVFQRCSDRSSIALWQSPTARRE